MYNRIDLRLHGSLKAGLLAAAPWLALILVMAVMAIYLHPLLLLAIIPAVSGAWCRWQRCGTLIHPQAIVRMTVKDSQLIATLQNQQERTMTVNRDSRLTGDLAILSLRHGSHSWPCPVILCSPGNVSEGEFRRMRVWLRLAGHGHDRETAPQPAEFSGTLIKRLLPTRAR